MLSLPSDFDKNEEISHAQPYSQFYKKRNRAVCCYGACNGINADCADKQRIHKLYRFSHACAVVFAEFLSLSLFSGIVLT